MPEHQDDQDYPISSSYRYGKRIKSNMRPKGTEANRPAVTENDMDMIYTQLSRYGINPQEGNPGKSRGVEKE